MGTEWTLACLGRDQNVFRQVIAWIMAHCREPSWTMWLSCQVNSSVSIISPPKMTNHELTVRDFWGVLQFWAVTLFWQSNRVTSSAWIVSKLPTITDGLVCMFQSNKLEESSLLAFFLLPLAFTLIPPSVLLLCGISWEDESKQPFTPAIPPTTEQRKLSHPGLTEFVGGIYSVTLLQLHH